MRSPLACVSANGVQAQSSRVKVLCMQALTAEEGSPGQHRKAQTRRRRRRYARPVHAPLLWLRALKRARLDAGPCGAFLWTQAAGQ